MPDYPAVLTVIGFDEHPSVQELIQDLSNAYLYPCNKLERRHLIHKAVLKFHLPIALNSSWPEDFRRNRQKHPVLNNMTSPSLDLVITLLCTDKGVFDSAFQEVSDADAHFGDLMLLMTASKMCYILKGRNNYLAPHFIDHILEIEDIVMELYGKHDEVRKKTMLVVGPTVIEPFGSNIVWNKLLSFSSYSELKESIPDLTCSICIDSDIAEDDFAILDSCRHVFCTACISKWFENGYDLHLP